VRHLAIGDIHGCLRALTTLVEYVGFESDDVLITLGDYVDRGPDSRAVLDWLIAFASTGRLVPLRGNHDLMMLQARDDVPTFEDWIGFGGDATLASYCPVGDAGTLADVPDEHWEFLENGLLPWYETDMHFFVHANACPDLPLCEQPDYMLYWESFGDPPAHESGKTMVCGHTSQKSGLPLNIGHAVCIDTWVYGEGWLTCLDPASGEYWQANQSGETRRGRLERVRS
jgi:serine/threonine protein phosphatase 1